MFKSVKVNKNNLLEVIHQNKEKHILEYEEAMQDYALVLLSVSEKNFRIAIQRLSQIRATGKIKDLPWQSLPNEPQSYEAEYTRAIRMLEMSVENDLDVEAQVFNQLALDEWSWKGQFLAYTTSLKGML